MNMGTKNKKRAVLPSRPEPPAVQQILEDIDRAFPDDPVFTILDDSSQGSAHSADREVELKYQQSRSYLQLNETLQEVRGQLVRQRDELRAVGEQLEHTVAEVKGRAL
ncbi:UPF0449 protein C19orf25 homolog [Polymixia lowei]